MKHYDLGTIKKVDLKSVWPHEGDSGEYSDIFNEVMQQAIIKAGEAVHADPKAAALRQALSEAYGIDGEDVDGLIEAVKNGKVKDDAY